MVSSAGSGKMTGGSWPYNSTLDHMLKYSTVVPQGSCVFYKRLSLVYQSGRFITVTSFEFYPPSTEEALFKLWPSVSVGSCSSFTLIFLRGTFVTSVTWRTPFCQYKKCRRFVSSCQSSFTVFHLRPIWFHIRFLELFSIKELRNGRLWDNSTV